MACTTENLRTAFSDPLHASGENNDNGKRLSSVLVVDDEPGILSFLQKGLSPQFSLVEVAADASIVDRFMGLAGRDPSTAR